MQELKTRPPFIIHEVKLMNLISLKASASISSNENHTDARKNNHIDAGRLTLQFT